MLDNPSEAPQDLPPHLRYLKTLVTVLAATMILGLITVIGLLVIRLGPQSTLPLPKEFALPAGAVAKAVTRTESEWIVLTQDGRVLVFSPAGEVVGEVRVR